jgi:hypothetical protein
MAFRPPKAIPEFKDLITTLNSSRISIENNALYQTLIGLIQRVSQLKTEVVTLISNNTSNISSIETTVEEIDNSVVRGPEPAVTTANAIARWADGSGRDLQNSSAILNDDGTISDVTDPVNDQDVATKKYVDDSVDAAVDFVVMSDGGNPPLPMDDGNGNFLYIEYNA